MGILETDNRDCSTTETIHDSALKRPVHVVTTFVTVFFVSNKILKPVLIFALNNKVCLILRWLLNEVLPLLLGKKTDH